MLSKELHQIMNQLSRIALAPPFDINAYNTICETLAITSLQYSKKVRAINIKKKQGETWLDHEELQQLTATQQEITQFHQGFEKLKTPTHEYLKPVASCLIGLGKLFEISCENDLDIAQLVCVAMLYLINTRPPTDPSKAIETPITEELSQKYQSLAYAFVRPEFGARNLISLLKNRQAISDEYLLSLLQFALGPTHFTSSLSMLESLETTVTDPFYHHFLAGLIYLLSPSHQQPSKGVELLRISQLSIETARPVYLVASALFNLFEEKPLCASYAFFTHHDPLNDAAIKLYFSLYTDLLPTTSLEREKLEEAIQQPTPSYRLFREPLLTLTTHPEPLKERSDTDTINEEIFKIFETLMKANKSYP